MLKVLLLVLASVSLSAYATDHELDRLEDRVKSFQEKIEANERISLENRVDFILEGLAKTTNPIEESSVFGCQEASVEVLDRRFAVSFNKQGEACKIYDLSFPHLKMLGFERRVTQVSTQKFSWGDYNNWLDGDYQAVYNKINKYNAQTTNAADPEVANWVKNIRLKDSTDRVKVNGFVQSFYASDLDFRRVPKLNRYQQNRYMKVLDKLANYEQSDSLSANLGEWKALVVEPNSILEKIRFDWNDAKKIYDVILEGQFLPINGPIALVDYDKPHKLVVEGIARRITKMAIDQAMSRIRIPGKAAVQFAINEAFESLERAYAYQMNYLETNLRIARKDKSSILKTAQANKGLNQIFVNDSGIITEMVTRLVQGRKIPWDKLDKIGRKRQFEVEKARDVSMDANNNYLAKKKSCKTEMFYEYFALCDGDKVYSLLSRSSILGFDLGPSVAYDMTSPNSVFTRRFASYILSGALQVVDFPLSQWLTSNLATILKDYALTGIQEEAHLLSKLVHKSLYEKNLSAEEEVMMDNLYMQNINFFTPKSVRMEEAMIEANKRLLGI